MTIARFREICKTRLERVPREALILGVLLLSCMASFGLGYLAGEGAGDSGPFPVIDLMYATSSSAGQFVASKNGTKYYLPWCGGADRISDANKVWFASERDAEASGYAPASGCDGL